MEYVLTTSGLTKSFRGKRAVSEASIHVAKGDIYGFVGENGSGKTTLIRIITGLVFPDAGEFTLFGARSTEAAIGKARQRIGAIVETPSLYRGMSAADNLRLTARLYGLPEDEDRIRATLAAVGLADIYSEKKSAGDFSLGMRQRLGIAMALLGDPELILLDEPMNGLDPAGIVEVRELILRLNRERGITFLISSHLLSELALVATKYGIISHGAILREISAEELSRECCRYVLLRTADTPALEALLRRAYPAHEIVCRGDTCRIAGDPPLNELLSLVLSEGITLDSVNCTEASLEDYYLSLVGGKQ